MLVPPGQLVWGNGAQVLPEMGMPGILDHETGEINRAFGFCITEEKLEEKVDLARSDEADWHAPEHEVNVDGPEWIQDQPKGALYVAYSIPPKKRAGAIWHELAHLAFDDCSPKGAIALLDFYSSAQFWHLIEFSIGGEPALIRPSELLSMSFEFGWADLSVYRDPAACMRMAVDFVRKVQRNASFPFLNDDKIDLANREFNKLAYTLSRYAPDVYLLVETWPEGVG